MNKLLVSLTIIVLISCNREKQKVVQHRWGKTVLTYDEVNDSLNYLYEDYYISGHLNARGKYINGKKEGHWKWWFENGNKKDEAFFSEGMYITKRTHWRENGKLLKEEFITSPCSDACCDGKIIFYDEEDKIYQVRFNNGPSVTATNYMYHPGGKLFQEVQIIPYENDSGIENGKIIQYFENGNTQLTGNFDSGRRNGTWIWKDSIGNVTQTEYWDKSILTRRDKDADNK